jgi:hypothetical protein
MPSCRGPQGAPDGVDALLSEHFYETGDALAPDLF